MKTLLMTLAAAISLTASADFVWKGESLNAWTNATKSIRGYELTDDGLVARMGGWQDSCVEVKFPKPLAVDGEWELAFRAKAICPETGRLRPGAKVKPRFDTMADYANHESTAFNWYTDGDWHDYKIRPFRAAAGRKLVSLKIQLPPEGYSSGVITFKGIVLRHRPVAPTFTVMAAEADGFARVGKPFEARVRVWNRGTAAADGVSLAVASLPPGVRVVRAPATDETVDADAAFTFRATLVADRPLDGQAAFSLAADGVAPLKVDVPVRVEAAPKAAKAAYVPEPQPAQTDYEIAACYYPGWMERERWERVRRVAPEREPLLGWYDEAKTEAIDWQLKWYAEHGIGVLMLDWYWNRGNIRLDHFLQAYRKAKYRSQVKWMVMWCNESQKAGTHDEADHLAVTKHWIEHYFPMPEYYRIDGKPVVGIFVPEHYTRDFGEKKTKELLETSRRMAREAGYPGIHLIGFTRPEDNVAAGTFRHLQDLGFDEIARYNCRGAYGPTGAPERFSWRDTVEFNLKAWDLYNASGVPFWPLASSGWDDRPWNGGCEMYGRNVKDFRRLLEGLKAFADKTGRKRIMIGPINEWGEGSFFEPNRQFGFGMYDAIRDVFCKKPANGWPANLVPSDVGLGPYDLALADPDLRADEPIDFMDGRIHGAQPLHYEGLTPGKDGLSVKPASKLPAVVINFESFKAKHYARLVVRSRAKTAATGVGMRLYWRTEGRPWCEQCAANPVSRFVADGTMQETVFDLSKFDTWNRRALAIRLQYYASGEMPEILIERVAFEPALPEPLKAVGAWKVRYAADGLRGEFAVDPADRVSVAGERHAFLAPPVTGKAPWKKPCQFEAVRAMECMALHAVDPSSVRIRLASDGRELVRDRDYSIDAKWGSFEWMPGAEPVTNAEILVDYAYRLRRIDSVVVRADGTLGYLKGAAHLLNPEPPVLGAGLRRLANVYVDPETTKLESRNLYPVLEATMPKSAPSADPLAAKMLPKTWAKLQKGEPVTILAWGDSVTVGSFVKPEEKWQNRFVRRLQEKFPNARITLVSNGWGGRSSWSFLGQPAGDSHNFEEKVVGVKADLVVSEFINDCAASPSNVAKHYPNYLKQFKAAGSEWLILAPHYINPYKTDRIDCHGTDDDARPFMKAVKSFAAENGVPIADTAKRWGHLWREGIPFSTLYRNDINHPVGPAMAYFADALMEVFGD